jgi:putative restriction endonuclease
MNVADLDDELRAAAIAYLDGISGGSGTHVALRDLESFTFNGRRLSLIQRMRGIRKVSGFEAALSFMTTYAPRLDLRPYADDVGPDGYPRYKWRGTDPNFYDNVAMRRAMERRKPLMYFVGVGASEYVAHYPVWLVDEEPEHHQFVVALESEMRAQWDAPMFHPADLVRRREYALTQVRRRLHQPLFRANVLRAYESRCALCRLRHRALLDAAHIREDREGGEPVVPNGVAMCAIHHRAFDAHVLGVRPDYVVELRRDVLTEQDGPTLRHALQGMHQSALTVPRDRRAQPDRQLLEERYERFRLAG